MNHGGLKTGELYGPVTEGRRGGGGECVVGMPIPEEGVGIYKPEVSRVSDDTV